MIRTLPKRHLAFAALLVATAIWGVATPIIKLTLSHISLFSFLFFRFLVVCCILLPVTALELKRNPIDKSEILRFTGKCKEILNNLNDDNINNIRSKIKELTEGKT